MAKDVKVRFIASDEISSTLRGMRGRLESFSRSVTKIAAGIGLADSFKAVGRAIKDSIAAAAEAYPKLGAGLERVGAKFTEFRVQVGAAFLEVLQPALPLIEQLVDWATKLATQIPNAFDGFRITMAEIAGWFESVPSMVKIMFAKIEQEVAAFVGGPIAAGLIFFGISGGHELAARLMVHSAMVIESAKRTLAGIEAATDATIAKYGGSHDYGSRAPTKGDQAAIDAARKAAEQALVNRQSPYRKEVVDRRIPLRGQGQPSDVQSNEDAGLQGTRSIADVYDEALEPLLAFNAALEDQRSIFGDLLPPAMAGTMDAIAGITQSLADSLPAHSAVGKAAQFAAKTIARVEGGLAIIQGAKKIAEFSFPPNPAGIASGAGMIAQGIKLLNIGGGGGAPGGYTGGTGGSGGLGGSGVTERNRDLATRGKMVIHIKNGVMGTNTPEFRDLITSALGDARDLREVEFNYS